MNASADLNAVGEVRAFNRFYTAAIRSLDEHLPDAPLALTDARVLYELAQREAPIATDLIRALGIDAGYLSRILQRFQKRGWVQRLRSVEDARSSRIALTSSGRALFEHINSASQKQIQSLLSSLSASQVDMMVASMRAIRQSLQPEARATPITIRAHLAGDIAWIVHRQALLYAREYDWNLDYEQLALQITAQFLRTFRVGREYCWVAECGGEIVGAVFLVYASEQVAKLRLLYVESSMRGRGLGARLVQECIQFAQQAGYDILTLWTNSVLVSARRIYEAAGFRLIEERAHHSFGQDLLGQIWELPLRNSADGTRG